MIAAVKAKRATKRAESDRWNRLAETSENAQRVYHYLPGATQEAIAYWTDLTEGQVRHALDELRAANLVYHGWVRV